MPEIEDDPVSLPPPMMASPIQPIKPTAIIEETHEGTSEMEQLDTLGTICILINNVDLKYIFLYFYKAKFFQEAKFFIIIFTCLK